MSSHSSFLKHFGEHSWLMKADFKAVEAVVDVTHRYPEMFYPKDQ